MCCLAGSRHPRAGLDDVAVTPPVPGQGIGQQHRRKVVALGHAQQLGPIDTSALDGPQDVLDADVDPTTTDG